MAKQVQNHMGLMRVDLIQEGPVLHTIYVASSAVVHFLHGCSALCCAGRGVTRR